VCFVRAVAETVNAISNGQTIKSKIIEFSHTLINGMTGRSEKVSPFLIFLLCSICAMAVAGYGLYVIVQLTQYYQQSRCASANFIESVVNK
jgi:hypothetical protein